MIQSYKKLCFACPSVCSEYLIGPLYITDSMVISPDTFETTFPNRRGIEILRISCVMHPCDWIREYYLKNKQEKSFDTYIQWILQLHRGLVGEIFSCYKADSFLRVEDFPWCLIELFQDAGYPKSAIDKLRKIKGYESRARDLPRWNDWMLREFKEAEKETLHAYDYF